MFGTHSPQGLPGQRVPRPQVEVWLNRVLDRMCATLRHEIPEAVVTYEEKPREQWIFDYPAQIALTCTQIWWTTEVGLAFARLEEGYENAIKDYNKKQVRPVGVWPSRPVAQKRPNLGPPRPAPPQQWFCPRVENGKTQLEIHRFLFFLV